MHHLHNKKTLGLMWAILICSITTLAQQTLRYRVILPGINTSGFYGITLPPDVLAKCKRDLADIRLFDQSQKAVPCLNGNDLPDRNTTTFIEFPLSQKAFITDTTTTYIVENIDHLSVTQLYLRLRNADVMRKINISGSDGDKKWYAIKEDQPLTGAINSNNAIFEIMLTIPPSNYKYLRVRINNNHKDPVDILQAGVYKRQLAMRGFVDLPVLSFKQINTAKQSQVIINFKDTYPINKIQLNVASPRFYKRNVNVYELINGVYVLVAERVISSSDSAIFAFAAKTTSIKLELLNDDNPPLNIVGVKAYQLVETLVSYLEKDKQYQLLFGDSAMSAPNYDLKFFADSLQQWHVLKIPNTAVENNPVYKEKQGDKSTIPSWIIWVAIAVVLLILTALTLKLTKEVGKKTGETKTPSNTEQ